jgi:CheY-like chemotaxis protein
VNDSIDKQPFILCVDDDPINLAIYGELLNDKYDIETVSNGLDCLNMTEKRRPDLILLDVNMPEMNGLETCKKLKENQKTSDIPVIFVSALATDSELMEGYESGGNDYVTKPFNHEILTKKIIIALNNQQKSSHLLQKTSDVFAELQQTRSDSGNLAQLLNFLHLSHSINSFDLLAQIIFDCLSQFNLESSLLILDQPENLFWFSDDIDRPMEKQILESLNGQDRVIRFGTRLAINSACSTILIRNIPDDESQFSRLPDTVGILIEGLDARVRTIQTQQSLELRRYLVETLLEQSQTALDDISVSHKRQSKESARIIKSVERELGAFVKEGELADRQQRSLNNRINKMKVLIGGLGQSGFEAEAKLRIVIQQLMDVLSDQN